MVFEKQRTRCNKVDFGSMDFSCTPKALIVQNIQVGFRSMGIWPLNLYAIDKYLALAAQFVLAARDNEVGSDPFIGES